MLCLNFYLRKVCKLQELRESVGLSVYLQLQRAWVAQDRNICRMNKQMPGQGQELKRK